MATQNDGPVLLIVLDGVGEVETDVGNAVKLATTPVLNRLRAEHRFTTLRAHGTAVGLPSDGDMGNSEVGHNALGAGQVYEQGAKLVNDAIASGSLYEGEAWQTAIGRVKGKGTLHFIGLLSDGNVHSHIDHLLAMLRRAAEEGVARARCHILLDGRDVDGVSAHLYIDRLTRELRALSSGDRDYRIASGGGRMKITMDRYEADWPMVGAGWEHHVQGKGRGFPDALTAVEQYRAETPGILDQDLPGFVITEGGEAVGPVRDGDSVLFFNFRGDRAIEISRAFDEGDAFPGFDRGTRPDVFYAGMMEYDGDTHCPNNYLVGPPDIQNTLTDLLVEAGVTQFAVSETQKYGHITYFWNGNRSGKVDPRTEDYEEIGSDTLPFDQRPWMKAAEITDSLIRVIRAGKHRFIRANYANGDMVGHTGNLIAAIAAMTCLDLQLGRLLAEVARAGGVCMITADHGNCDQMYEMKNGAPVRDGDGFKVKTSHTLSPVPFFLFDPEKRVRGSLHSGDELGLANVAATISDVLGVAPRGVWRPSLIRADG